MSEMLNNYRWIENTHVRTEVAAVAIAVHAFRSEHGSFPESTEALVPYYLGSIPVDGFDGLPLRYSSQGDGFTVYSVGADGVDDGGKITGEDGSDLGWQVGGEA